MKLNSHLVGLGVVAAIVGFWMWNTDKEVEKFLGWTIFKSKGVFKVEYLMNTRDQNQTFQTLDEAKAWISTKVAAEKLRTAIPWGQ
jgi:hypothetical protein